MSDTKSQQIESWLNLPAKIRWKLFRQFQSPTDCLSSSDSSIHQTDLVTLFQWKTARLTTDEFSRKLLLQNDQRVQCEAVTLLPPKLEHSKRTPRATACISSQPGCGVGCPFCATGTLGYQGNLSATEIVEQVYWAGVQARLCGRGLRNIVFMGMGEPLHNADQVMQSIDWLTDSHLFGFPHRRIIVSTIGVPRAMIALAERFPAVRLALSLHSADPEQRKMLVPKATADLERLRDTIIQLNSLQSESLWVEVVLLAGVNDSIEHAERIVEFCRELCVEVNLIPYNSTDTNSVFRPTERSVRERFAERLRAAGIRTTIRNSLGSNNSAACGQLRVTASSAQPSNH